MFIGILVLWAMAALTFPLGKMALMVADSPAQLIGLRMLLAGFGMLLWLGLQTWWRGQKFITWQPGFRDALRFGKVALLHVYLAFVPEFWALQFLDSLKVNLLFSLTPFLSALLGFVLLGHRLSARKWTGLGVGAVGMLCLVVSQDPTEQSFAHFWIFSLPELVLLLGIASAAYAWFEIKKLLHRGYSLLTINAVAFLLGGAMCLGQHFLLGGACATLLPATGRMELFAWISGLILCSNVIFYQLYGRLLHQYSNTFLSFTGFLCPIFGAGFSKLFALAWPAHFCPEPISIFYLAGFACVALGLGIFYRQETQGFF